MFALKKLKKALDLHISDFAGQEDHRQIQSSFFGDLDMVLLLCDITNYISLENDVQDFLKRLRVLNKKASVILVLNKIDLLGKKVFNFNFQS